MVRLRRLPQEGAVQPMNPELFPSGRWNTFVDLLNPIIRR